MRDYVLINGKQSKITYNSSKGRMWTLESANDDTLKILNELTKFQDSSVMYQKGITVIKSLSTIELTSIGVTRPANHIGILRHELPANTIITFNTDGEKYPYYGIIKSDKSKKAISDFRERLLNLLALKSVVPHRESKGSH